MQSRSQTVIVLMVAPVNLLHYLLMGLVKLRWVIEFKKVITVVFLWTDYQQE